MFRDSSPLPALVRSACTPHCLTLTAEKPRQHHTPVTPSCHGLRLKGAAHMTDCTQESKLFTSRDGCVWHRHRWPQWELPLPSHCRSAGVGLVGGRNLRLTQVISGHFCDGVEAWHGAKEGIPAFRAGCQSGIKTRCGTPRAASERFDNCGLLNSDVSRWRQESPAQRL